MNSEIKFKQRGLYYGRHGYGKMFGIDFSYDTVHLVISPTNTRGVATSSMLKIPKEEIQGIIDELQKFI